MVSQCAASAQLETGRRASGSERALVGGFGRVGCEPPYGYAGRQQPGDLQAHAHDDGEADGLGELYVRVLGVLRWRVAADACPRKDNHLPGDEAGRRRAATPPTIRVRMSPCFSAISRLLGAQVSPIIAWVGHTARISMSA